MGLGSSLSCSIVQTLYKKKIRQLRCIIRDSVGSTFCEIGVGLSENIKSGDRSPYIMMQRSPCGANRSKSQEYLTGMSCSLIL